MKVFVTGGCGFFGAHIISRLIKDGDDVTVFDMTLFKGRWEMTMTPDEIGKIKFIQGRVDEDDLPTAILAEAPDAVIHLAGLQVPTCRDNPILGARVNVIGTLNVFEAAKRIVRGGGVQPAIVYASSAAVFGPDAEYATVDASTGAATAAAVSDTAVPKPSSHYGAFKLCIEHCARSYAPEISSVGLRPLTVYGPGRDTGITSFPTRAIAAALMDVDFEIPFSGPTAYIHVREVSDMFVTVAKTPMKGAKVYTVGGDTIDTPAFVALLESLHPGAAAHIRVAKGDLPIASRIDDAALRADYPSIIRIPIRDGIAETLEVFKGLKAAGKLTV